MNSNLNKWVEFSTEYAQVMNDNLQVMTKFWNASMEKNSTQNQKNIELFFDHMNRNVEIIHEIHNNATSSSEELKTAFKANIEKFNHRYQKVYEETIKAITPKTMNAGQ